MQYYQATAKDFEKHDLKYFNTGDGDGFKVVGHHFTPDLNVADHYAQRLSSNSDTFIKTVTFTGVVLPYKERFFADEVISNIIDNWYGTNNLCSDLSDQIADNASLFFGDCDKLSQILLAADEFSFDFEIQSMMRDAGFSQSDLLAFKKSRNIEHIPSLDFGMDHGCFVSVGQMLVSSVVARFPDLTDQLAMYESMGVIGVHYDNFGNGVEAKGQNACIWNDDAIEIIDTEPSYTNQLDASMSMA